jgi:hypothetical protein
VITPETTCSRNRYTHFSTYIHEAYDPRQDARKAGRGEELVFLLTSFEVTIMKTGEGIGIFSFIKICTSLPHFTKQKL